MSSTRPLVARSARADRPASPAPSLPPFVRLTLGCLIGAALAACSGGGSESAPAAATNTAAQDDVTQTAAADEGVEAGSMISADGEETLAALTDTDAFVAADVDGKATATPIAGKYYLKNACANKAATRQYATAPWDNMLVRAAGKTALSITRNSDGTYVFKVDGTNSVLQAEKVTPTAGTFVNIYTNWNGSMQRWALTAKGSGTYQIANAAARSMVLGVANAWSENSQMNLGWDSGSCTHRWTLVAVAGTTTSSTTTSTTTATTTAPAPAPAPTATAPAPAPAPTVTAPAPAPAPVVTAPAPAPAPTVVAPTTVNTVDTIINDMRLKNDLALAGVPTYYGWASGPGFVAMGNSPRGTSTPTWWTPANTTYKSAAWWNVLIPWFVVFDGVGNAATNTRVQMRNIKVYVKSASTGKWALMGASTGVGGALFPKTLQGNTNYSPNARTEADGSTAIKPPGGNLVYHGWCCGFLQLPAPWDIAAVHVTMQARLSIDNAALADDRAAAKYLLHMGADYYPDKNTTNVELFAPSSYAPGVGVSRAKLITNNWQAFSMTTLDVGMQDAPGRAISEAALRAAPPPLE